MLKSQYHAALAMLRDAIEQCPDAEWLSRDHKNAFWQVAYHVLFFAHLYLQQNETTFVLWSQHHGADDGTRGEPYSKAQVLEYWSFVDHAVDGAVDLLDLESPESGFSWYTMSSSSISWSISATSSITARNWPTDSARRPTSESNGWGVDPRCPEDGSAITFRLRPGSRKCKAVPNVRVDTP